MQDKQAVNSKRVGCIAVMLLAVLAGFSVAGYFIATPAQIFTLSVMWVVALGLIAAAIVAIFWGAAAYVWIRVKTLSFIYPDENGDLPVIRVGRHLINLNLVPYHTYRVTHNGQVEARDQDHPYTYRAWMVYLATRGKSGSPPAAAFNGDERLLPEPEPEAPPLITQPGQSRLIDVVAHEL